MLRKILAVDDSALIHQMYKLFLSRYKNCKLVSAMNGLEALDKLAGMYERKAQVVELRHFGGLTINETAEALGVGTTTVEDDWAFARSWLAVELGLDGQP